MAQAKRGGSGSTSGSGSGSRSAGSRAKRSTSGSSSSSGGRSTSRSTGSRSRQSSGSTASRSRSSSSASASTGDPRLDAVAQRVRRLNERIIDAGREAGETTLTNYEKALKAIANAVERGPGSSDIDWISSLATAQAKFIRDVTTAWTKAARDMLK